MLTLLTAETRKSNDWSRKKSVPLISNGAFSLSNYPNCHLGILSTDWQPACHAIGRFLYICPASDLQKDILVKATGIALRGHSECWHTMSINSGIAVSAERSIPTSQLSPAAFSYCTVFPERAKKPWGRQRFLLAGTDINSVWLHSGWALKDHRHLGNKSNKCCMLARVDPARGCFSWVKADCLNVGVFLGWSKDALWV